jgi:hypothetical protein
MGRARYLFVTAVVAALAGCGDDSTEDPADIARELERDVQDQTGTEDVRVLCDEDVGEGDLCEVRAAGGLRAQVRITRLEDSEVDGEVVQP